MAEAELTTIARPYARAAFSYALDESDGLKRWSRMLGLAAEAIQQDVVQRALDNPRLSTDEEAALLFDILGDELTGAGRNFVSILAEYGRIGLLPHVAELYESFRAQHEKTMDVEVTSAFPVEESDKARLEEALKRRLQKEISLTANVDAWLLGGAVVRTEDTVIDNSIRGKLEKLSHVLS